MFGWPSGLRQHAVNVPREISTSVGSNPTPNAIFLNMENKVMMRNCTVHGYTEFSFRKDGGFRCRKCVVEAVQRRREKVKKLAIEYKGGKCQCCGYHACDSALEFHHLSPDKKDFGIGQKGYTRSWEKIKQELDKCILVCANCHREIHSGIRKV